MPFDGECVRYQPARSWIGPLWLIFALLLLLLLASCSGGLTIGLNLRPVFDDEINQVSLIVTICVRSIDRVVVVVVGREGLVGVFGVLF